MKKIIEITDTYRLDFLQDNQFRGASILNDDNFHWAIVDSSFIDIHHDKIIKITDQEKEAETVIQFDVKKIEWKNSIREAIDAYIESCKVLDFDGRDI
jgi:hypothetical protein